MHYLCFNTYVEIVFQLIHLISISKNVSFIRVKIAELRCMSCIFLYDIEREEEIEKEEIRRRKQWAKIKEHQQQKMNVREWIKKGRGGEKMGKGIGKGEMGEQMIKRVENKGE